ncbi:MAG: oligoendopeptidase F family protein, partial [Nitrospinaceae bacterium]|nr:oligoendopeptidase F family protein [Nitrospinaceae bacterium]NIU97567.1 oligoendopeptidase F [Nitrospinaceae bacterium]
MEAEVGGYRRHRGRLGESTAALKACLEFDAQVLRTLDRLFTYAHLRNDEDKTNGVHQGNFEKTVRLSTRIQEARSFIQPELMA